MWQTCPVLISVNITCTKPDTNFLYSFTSTYQKGSICWVFSCKRSRKICQCKNAIIYNLKIKCKHATQTPRHRGQWWHSDRMFHWQELYRPNRGVLGYSNLLHLNWLSSTKKPACSENLPIQMVFAVSSTEGPHPSTVQAFITHLIFWPWSNSQTCWLLRSSVLVQFELSGAGLHRYCTKVKIDAGSQSWSYITSIKKDKYMDYC